MEDMTEKQTEEAIKDKRTGHAAPPVVRVSHFKHKVEKGQSGLLVCRNCKAFV